MIKSLTTFDRNKYEEKQKREAELKEQIERELIEEVKIINEDNVFLSEKELEDRDIEIMTIEEFTDILEPNENIEIKELMKETRENRVYWKIEATESEDDFEKYSIDITL